jgi:moderate conductance mechanosensitive channel
MPAWLVDIWQNWHTLIRIVLLLLGTVVLRSLLLLSVKRVVKGIVSGVKSKAGKTDTAAIDVSPLAKERVVQRARTMGSVLSNFITWGLAIVAVTMVLSELGVAVGALIAGAGILGAAIGFGAQSLVKDLISGLFIVFEDQYGVGDSVDLGQASGIVETVGLRVTQVRDSAGTLWYVRNGEVNRVGNQSQGWSRVVLDVAVPYRSDFDAAQATIAEAAQTLAQHADYKQLVIGAPEVWGIEALSGDQVVIRLAQQVRPAHSDEVARALRLAIKNALDAAKIELASNKQSIFVEISDRKTKA